MKPYNGQPFAPEAQGGHNGWYKYTKINRTCKLELSQQKGLQESLNEIPLEWSFQLVLEPVF